METYEISAAADARALRPIMMALHELLHRLPVTARSCDRPGIRIEAGRVAGDNNAGPVFEEVLATDETRRIGPPTGVCCSTPVVVPERDSVGAAIAATGVVDITGVFDIASLMEQQSGLVRGVCGTGFRPLDGPYKEPDR